MTSHIQRRLARCIVATALVGSVFGVLSAQQDAEPRSQTMPRPLNLPGQGASLTASDDLDPVASALWTGGRYRLTPSDVIELRFPYVSEFDQTVTVQPDGYVSLRVIGDLRVQGRTLPELRALLSEAYAETLREPVVNIVLREFEKPYFIVAGEVARPGKYELRGATTLTQSLVLAGGQTHAAKHSQVVLFRRFSTEWVEVKQVDVKSMYARRDLSEDPLLRPGDTVFVPTSALSKIAPLIPRAGLGLYLNPFSR